MIGKKIVVLGGAGFIGHHLVERLIREKPAEIIVIDNLVHHQGFPLYSTDVKVVFLERDFNFMPLEVLDDADIVFNLAVLSLPHSLVFPEANLNNNIQIVSKLCEVLRAGRFKKLVHFSSSEVYGSALRTPMDESHPFTPSTPYAVSKAACDLLILSYCKMYPVFPATILRPFNNYGPGQNDKSYAGVIPLTIKRLMEGQAPIVYGSGTQTRDYVWVGDTCRAAIQVAKDSGALSYGKVFNIASGKETSIIDLVVQISRIYNSLTNAAEKNIIFDVARPGDVLRHIGSCYLLKDTFGCEPKTRLLDGLVETVDWYIKEEAKHG